MLRLSVPPEKQLRRHAPEHLHPVSGWVAIHLINPSLFGLLVCIAFRHIKTRVRACQLRYGVAFVTADNFVAKVKTAELTSGLQEIVPRTLSPRPYMYEESA